LSEKIAIDGKNIVIIDDVSNSGRTLVYALKPLLEAHPKTIQSMVLVERMHQLFPVKPDYIGLSLATTKENHIQVEVKDGEIMGAYVI
jgi:pyrimidine operon attenuation protein/uracil phosphoribosyltransferase